QVGFQVEAGRVVCLRAGRGFQVDEGVVLGLVGIVLSMPVAWRIPTIAGCDMGGANGLARQPCIQPIGTERTGALGIGVQCTAGLRIEVQDIDGQPTGLGFRRPGQGISEGAPIGEGRVERRPDTVGVGLAVVRHERGAASVVIGEVEPGWSARYLTWPDRWADIPGRAVAAGCVRP
ncbi:MAG: hypothetical protein J7M25_07115, partial [Deltaproteobacteria bacterium]|nr:hypothetical protein [Deltaproteobacteria bacterium]